MSGDSMIANKIVCKKSLCNNIQLMTFDKVDTVIYQPRRGNVH